ncbi:translation initiation factor eIF-2B subunit epsilon [Athalia rosae]|uniref:translation initiation factor eIF-2B subunit epsilon n=1 Tax=Athalia rosae TaxID=37344 RepID=UPI0020341CB4|nr:translation initiation factor eIF-2B subunit epsilon [Athalia rosae]
MSKKIATELKKEDVLQAVVLADDFTVNLNPMHNIFPSVLTPVVNIPLLDYLTETLVKCEIQELFLYCSNHIQLLKKYIKNKNFKDLNVHLIISDGCRSLGDALRDIDTKGLIRGNFILIRGDAFTNANLKNLLDWHRSKTKQDKGAAMTLVLRDLGSSNVSSQENETCMIAADNLNNRVLFHQKLNVEDKKVKLELQWFLDHDHVGIHSSLLDSHIYLCSALVLPLFSDNFDFQTMEDFIRGLLINEEILDSRIYWQKLNAEEYALPVTSWRAYDTLSREILQRRGYPLTADTMPSTKNFVYLRRSTYKHRSVTLAKGCTLERDSIICPNSKLGENTYITSSVIGENCNLGNNVRVEKSYILGDVTICDNCIIKNSVIFFNSELQHSVDINGCIIGPKLKLKSKSTYVDSVMQLDGKGGIAQTPMSKANPDTNEDLSFFKYADAGKTNSDHSDFDDGSSSEEESDLGAPLPDDTHMFLTEVIDSLLRGYQDKVKCENLILEINSSRYAYNVSIREVSYNVVKAILSLPLHYLSEIGTDHSTANYQKTLKQMLEYFHTILANYVKTEDAQEDCLRAIEDTVATNEEVLLGAQLLFNYFYNRDVLGEDKILEWYQLNDDDEDDMQKEVRSKIRKVVQPFIKWLQEAEEDSSEEEEDSD